MARNRDRKRDASVTQIPSLTLTRLLPDPRPLSPLSDRVRFEDDLLSDRRTYHPLGDFRPASFSTGGPSRIVAKDRSYGRRSPVFGSSGTKAVQAFGEPDATSVCVRRHRRREVLFANRKAGKGGRKKRAYRRNWYSSIKC